MAEKSRGLIMVHTGDGKGKTTAALGLAFRAVGDGLTVLMMQFIKSAKKTGELKAAARLAPDIEIVQVGRGFVWSADKMELHRNAARRGLDEARSGVLSGLYDMVILDEINVALHLGLLEEAAVLQLIDEKPPGLHLLLTGRSAPQAILDRADLVTEMREVKHHFHAGVSAQKGIEY